MLSACAQACTPDSAQPVPFRFIAPLHLHLCSQSVPMRVRLFLHIDSLFFSFTSNCFAMLRVSSSFDYGFILVLCVPIRGQYTSIAFLRFSRCFLACAFHCLIHAFSPWFLFVSISYFRLLTLFSSTYVIFTYFPVVKNFGVVILSLLFDYLVNVSRKGLDIAFIE